MDTTMIHKCNGCGAEWGEYEAKWHHPSCIADCTALPEVKDAATGKESSTGGSSGYYKLPEDAEDLQDLIELKEMSFARGNLFKALYRMGEKEGIDVGYDLNKLQWFLNRMRKMHRKGLRL